MKTYAAMTERQSKDRGFMHLSKIWRTNDTIFCVILKDTYRALELEARLF